MTTKELDIDRASKTAIWTICGLLIFLEYIFSLTMNIQFYYMLPTKSFLSSKSWTLSVLTLTHKVILQAFQVSFGPNIRSGVWVINTVSLLLSISRHIHFFTSLPLYNLEALFYQGSLLSIVISLNLSCFIQDLLLHFGYQQADLNFIIVIWIILSVFAVKLSHEVLGRKITSLIVSCSASSSPELLVHKVSATKQLRGLPQESTWINVLKTTQDANISSIFGLDLDVFGDQNLNLDDKEDANKVFIQYLEQLSLKHPSSPLIRLHLVWIYVKNKGFYAKAVRLATNIERAQWSSSQISASFILYQAEQAILNNNNNTTGSLDLSKYIRTTLSLDKLKTNMLKQTDLKLSICSNILIDSPDIGVIFNDAQSAQKYKLQSNTTSTAFAIPSQTTALRYACCALNTIEL